MTAAPLRDEINKRLTLNWLIQGAAQHAGMTLHHLVRDEILAIDPKLIRLYDQYALINLLQYWQPDAVLLLGWPPRFWRRAARSDRHPFFGHPLLSRHGGTLAAAARRRARDRCKEKGLTRLPVVFTCQTAVVMARLQAREKPHRHALIELAKTSAATVWGIPPSRFQADLTDRVAFGELSAPTTVRGQLLRACAVGYGGVLRDGDSLSVVAKASNWYLLAKELVKGTAELICLHGLNRLDDDTYRRVVAATDRIEYEPWMLQTGGELWRRLVTLIPADRPAARVLMHLAQLPPRSLESIIGSVIERPEWARELLQGLGRCEPDA